jgi:hypothetical protein
MEGRDAWRRCSQQRESSAKGLGQESAGDV